jgi:glycosyltransferase involved in cell wall biosynthesis
MLPLGVLLKRATGARVVYDPHELETEANGLSGARRRVSKVLERLLYRAADAVIVVGDEIADWYQREYGGVRPSVVLNCPPRRALSRTSVLRDACEVPEDATVFLYQGILGPGRGIELMLDAFLQADDPHRVLVLLGMGPLEPLISKRAQDSKSIRLHPAVPPQRLAEYTASADVGMCLIEDTCLSYRYCMPNKLFEYLAAGVPPLVSNLPGIARVVDRYGAGWVLPDWSPAALRTIVRSIGPADVASRRMGTADAAGVYTWEAQVPALLAVYERLRFKAGDSPQAAA